MSESRMTQIKGLRGQEKENQSVESGTQIDGLRGLDLIEKDKSVQSAKSLKSAILTSDAVKLGDVCEINPRRPVIKRNDDTETSFIPMAAVNDETGTLKRIEIKSYSEVKKGYTWFADNDVIFAKITPCMENGKQAIVRNLIDGFGFGSTEFHVLRASNIILPEWIHLYVRQQTVLDEAARHFTGAVGQQRVPQDFLANIKIPLPPLTIQKEIADYLQYRLTCVEAAKQAVKAELEAAKALKQAYLREVFGTADDTDSGITPIMPNPKKGKSEQSASSFKSAILTSDTVKLGDMCEIKDGTHFSPKNLSEGDYKYITAKNIKEYRLDFSKLTYVSAKDHKEIFSRCPVSLGDVLYIKDGATAGIACENTLDEEFSLLSSVALLKPNKKIVTSTYIVYFLNSGIGRKLMLDQVDGGAITRLTLTKISNSKIPLPPLAVQKEIADYLQAKFTTVDTLVLALTEKKKAIDDLPQAFLREVFSIADDTD